MRPSVWKPNLLSDFDLEVLVGLQHRQQIERQVFHEVDVAGLQRVHRGLRVGHREPFDAIDFDHLAAGGPARRLLARHVVGVLLVGHLHAGLEFSLHEFERAGADLLGDRLAGSVSANRFGIMNGTSDDGLPSDSSTRP